MVQRRLTCSFAFAILAAAVVVACGGALDNAQTDQRASGVSAGEPTSPRAEGGRPAQPAPATEDDCSSLVVNCQGFDPGGPDRWGCFTDGTDPELACEHAAGTVIAHCNCSGAFGDRDPAVSAAEGITWFEVSATNTPFSAPEAIRIWRDHCHGRCVPRQAPPPPLVDGG